MNSEHTGYAEQTSTHTEDNIEQTYAHTRSSNPKKAEPCECAYEFK